MQISYTETVNMIAINCAECGILFAIPEKYSTERRADHATFYCPNKHSNYYPGKSEAEKLKEQLQAKEKELKLTLANLEAEKKKVKLPEKQPCPLCHKRYKHLAQHIANKHPKRD